MDDADRAQQATDLELSIALSNRKPELPETGLCHNCDMIMGVGNFCTAECQSDHEQLKRMKG